MKTNSNNVAIAPLSIVENAKKSTSVTKLLTKAAGAFCLLMCIVSFSTSSVYADWISSDSSKAVPRGAVIAGIDELAGIDAQKDTNLLILGNPTPNIYVCRVTFQGGLHPGKLVLEPTPFYGFSFFTFLVPKPRCHFGYGGLERSSDTYQVLVDNGVWLPGSTTGASIGGREADGRSLYICRAAVTDYMGKKHGTASGKVVNNFCNIGYGGKEKTFASYSLFYSYSASSMEPNAGVKNLGMVGVKSIYGSYLQAYYYSNWNWLFGAGNEAGQLHASNPHRNEEETWFLDEIDHENHIFALYNWRNGNFISKEYYANNDTDHGSAVQAGNYGPCVPTKLSTLTVSEQWVMVPGQNFGVPNAVAFRSLVDGSYLHANAPNNNFNCGGEVATIFDQPPQNDGRWEGWFIMEPADAPSRGTDVWNYIGGKLDNILNKITPADIGKLLSSLL
jgi:hypothetical protein